MGEGKKECKRNRGKSFAVFPFFPGSIFFETFFFFSAVRSFFKVESVGPSASYSLRLSCGNAKLVIRKLGSKSKVLRAARLKLASQIKIM